MLISKGLNFLRLEISFVWLSLRKNNYSVLCSCQSDLTESKQCFNFLSAKVKCLKLKEHKTASRFHVLDNSRPVRVLLSRVSLWMKLSRDCDCPTRCPLSISRCYKSLTSCPVIIDDDPYYRWSAFKMPLIPSIWKQGEPTNLEYRT